MNEILIADLPKGLVRVTGGSFQLLPVGETSIGSFSPAPRSTGARFMVWRTELSIITPTEADRGRWRVFISKLEGVKFAFPLFDPTRPLPLGVAAGVYEGSVNAEIQYTDGGGSPFSFASNMKITSGSTVCRVGSAAAAGDDTVLLSGLVPENDVFTFGDYIEIGRNLYQVTAPARSNADGESRVIIGPRLWHPVLAGTEVNLGKASGMFMLVDPQSGALGHAVNTVSGTTIAAVSIPWTA